MENPNIKTKVAHSATKSAWNVIGTIPGGKFKIARIPYCISENFEQLNTKQKYEALLHAEFISKCFNALDQMKSFCEKLAKEGEFIESKLIEYKEVIKAVNTKK